MYNNGDYILKSMLPLLYGLFTMLLVLVKISTHTRALSLLVVACAATSVGFFLSLSVSTVKIIAKYNTKRKSYATHGTV